jgi:hypothetical protein
VNADKLQSAQHLFCFGVITDAIHPLWPGIFRGHRATLRNPMKALAARGASSIESGMAMGTRQQRQRQGELWVATATLARPASHPFYDRLNRVLDECQFDEFVKEYVNGSMPRRWVVRD